ncbi:MAG: gamma-glutamylcyclotransferase family protein [Gemmatimonadota bacterium]|nr:gamma-glutamylcyclotransferase family protein [Gemmatimonadota bacterium]
MHLPPGPRLPLFAYGSLVDEAFVGRLLERSVTAVSARLLDFELLEIEGMPVPTVFEAVGEVVDGRLYRDLEPTEYQRLDAYEGVHEGLYTRITARVVAADREGGTEPSFVYVATERTLRRYGAL